MIVNRHDRRKLKKVNREAIKEGETKFKIKVRYWNFKRLVLLKTPSIKRFGFKWMPEEKNPNFKEFFVLMFFGSAWSVGKIK